MEELFSGNLFMIYAVACIALISYSNFKENQRMFLLYFLSYATAFFKVLGIVISLGTLLIITFIFLEYLAEDSKKLELITKLSYKILDYLFMMFLQYSFVWILMAFAVLLLIDNCKYSKIIFASLKKYHAANTYLSFKYYRQYILYVYFHTVMTKINEHRYRPFSSVFESERIEEWPMEGVFIACLGLSFRSPDDETLKVFDGIVRQFNIDIDTVKKMRKLEPRNGDKYRPYSI